ncbi:MAG: ATP synthase F1 subunit delta [Oscillochloris sp.]|nr:ATP synthase F1 subunit delta [Oscillochloris sp.]
MATTVDAKAIAGTLYDTLMGTALGQLETAAARLADTSGDNVAARIYAALPGDALPQVRNFLLGLAKEGLLDQVGDIAVAFRTLTTSPSAQALAAVITSAVELSAEQQANILADLRARYGVELNATFTVDSSLIGGLIIRVGDRVLDNSLRTRLSAIQRNMLTS